MKQLVSAVAGFVVAMAITAYGVSQIPTSHDIVYHDGTRVRFYGVVKHQRTQYGNWTSETPFHLEQEDGTSTTGWASNGYRYLLMRAIEGEVLQELKP